MSDVEKDGAAVRIPPPLIYLGAIVAGYVVHDFVLPLPLDCLPGNRVAWSVAVSLLGVAFMAGAVWLFRRSGQDPKPWKPTPEIVAAGVYRVSRNPMYVGMSILQAGIGLAMANGWVLALVPLSLYVVHWTAVRHEEAYLERKFGQTYLDYKEAVRRWL